MVKGPGYGMSTEDGEKQSMLSSKLRSPSRHSDASTMDSFQDGGQPHMNSEHNDFQGGMDGPFMNPDMNSYGQNPGDQSMGPDAYGRMNEGMHHGQMGQYNSYGRPGYSTMEGGNMGNSEYSSHNAGYGQYPQGGSRQGYPGMSRPGMGPVRPGMGSHGMGMMPSGYNPNQQRMMGNQGMGQQSGPTPTLNQLLQTPNSQPRYPPNSYESYGGPQKPGDMSSSNGPYGMPPQGWMQNQRGMGYNNQMPMQGSSPYRGQGGPPGYGPQGQPGYNQSTPVSSQSQYNSQGSIQQQPQPPGQPPGQQQQQHQQRPTPQPSPHQQQVSPTPSPGHRSSRNPSPGPSRPAPQASPAGQSGGQQRSSQLSPSPSQRSSSSQLSPPGSSPNQPNSLPNSQHNHQSSPKDTTTDDVKGEIVNSSSRPEASPGSVGSRSNTPASVSGSSPMPPRPPSQQDGSQGTMRMNQSAMPAPGYSQQMMPPPMGPNQMGYSPGGSKMGPGGPYPSHYQNSQYPPSGNYGMRQPGPGMGGYQQNMYNGPSQMGGPMGPSSGGQMGPGGPGPGGPSQMSGPGPNQMGGPNHMGPNGPTGHVGPNGPAGQMSASGQMYNSMSGPGMSRNNYMYGGQGGMMGMNNHYGNYSGPVTSTNSQSGPGPGMSGPGPGMSGPGPGMSSPGPNTNGPQGNMVNSMGSGNTGSNGPMATGSSQGQTPIKGAQAAAQAAMAAAQAAARSQQASSQGRSSGGVNMSQSSRYNPSAMGSHSMPPQSMSPLSQMGQMNQMGYNATMNNMPHPQNSVSPVPNAMGHGPPPHGMPPSGGPGSKMHNNSNNFNEQPLPKSKSKSKSKDNSSSLPLSSNMPNSMSDKPMHGHMPSPQRSMMSPSVPDSNVPNTQPLPSSTPTSSLSDASTHSNDSSSMGPLAHTNDSNNTGPGPPGNTDNMVGSSSGPISDDSVSTSVTMPQKESQAENGVPGSNDEHPITTTANNVAIENSTSVTHSIMSPVTSISTEAGNSNDSQPIPNEPVTSIQNCIPSHQVTEEPSEPPEKKRKTELSQLAFTRVAPSPGGASVASSGTHDDIDNIGSPGWPSTPKSGAGDQMKLYEMGMEPQRRPFLDRLFIYLEEKGTPITAMPVISKQPLDLYRLYLCVQEKGGMVEVTKLKKWKEICGLVNISGSASAAFTLKKNYIKFLFAYECRFDRGGMDPTPILNQMESDLEKKRAAKQRHRAPSPAGSQGSQDGMPVQNQYLQNEHSMGHMGQPMMGNHMMNNMGHGGPMMGPNNMGGPPHPHMGPGMQGPPAHMMGNMGPQGSMMGGNNSYMMPGGPNNMMGNNMGPQGGMMGPGSGMHGPGPNSMMGNMGPNGPQSMGPGGPPMHNSMNPMMNNMNMPNSNMMGPGNMMSGGMGGHQQPGMMPPNSMNPQQQHMMRNMGPGAPNMMPPGGMMRGNSDSVSCMDPFADEPYSRPNQGMPPYSVQQSSSPLPLVNSGPMQSSVNSSMPVSSGANVMSSASISKQDLPPHSASGMMTPPTQSQPSSDVPPTSGATTPQSSDAPASSLAQQQSSGASIVNSGASAPLTSSPGVTTNSSSSFGQQNLPNTFGGLDSNSNSSLGMELRNDMMAASSAQSSQSLSASMPGAHGDGSMNSSSQFGNTTSVSSSSGRNFPFGDQFTKPDRFDQSSPSNSMAQPHVPPPMSQAPPMMNQPINQYPHPMDQSAYPGRHANPMQQHPPSSGPEHFNQGYHGNQPAYSGPPRPMMPNDQYQGYPNQQGQYGKAPMNRDMSGSIYNTPNKRYPDGRNDSYMSPAFNPRGLLNFDDRPVPTSLPLPRPFYPDFNMDSPNFATYGPNSYSGSMNYGDAPSYHSSPHQYPGYGGDSGTLCPDRRESNQWSPMPQQRGYHGMPPYGQGQMSGMSPSGPPNMSHIPRMRMSPNRNREYTMSPSNKKMTGSGMPGQYKKEMHFPMDTVESTQPLLSKRKRLTKHDIGPLGYKDVVPGGKRIRGMHGPGQIEAWRIMMALKSGLLAESSWALDTLNILLYDDSTVTYFGLAHLPGLLEVLLDHFRRCLIDMFGLFEETQIGCGQDDFRQNLIRMAILETAKEVGLDSVTSESKEISRANKTIGKLDERMKEDSVEKDMVKVEPEEKMEVDEGDVNKAKAAAASPAAVDGAVDLNDSGREWKLRPNYTMISRQGKEVKIEEKSDPNGLLDDKFWDVYCEFGDQSELWEYGKGDLTDHIVTHLEDMNEHLRSSKKFFRKSRKAHSPLELSEMLHESKMKLIESADNSKAIKTEIVEEPSNSISDRDVNSSDARSASPTNGINEKLEDSSEKSNSDKCDVDEDNKSENLLTDVKIKTEPKDEENASETSNGKPEEQKSFFRDEPRIKLAVKYELLDNTELVQTFKNMFGINTEGERNNVEDESYQRNEPPLCLTTEAQHEIGRRCVCISNIFRSLSCIPGNDTEMSRHAGLVYILGKLLLLHHKHLPRSRVRRKFDRDDVDEDMVDTSQGAEEWWWDYLNMLRENTLVIFANICAQLRMDLFPDEICVPALEGLIHWVVCPSSCATDPLPTVGPTSVLSPLRLVLEAMCKLCIHDKNVDMILAMPPYERIVQLFSVLTKLLANKAEQVTVEFSIVLLSELVKGGSSASRGVALQHPCISLLIDFLETAEQKAVQVANMNTIQMLRDNPEMMGTSLDMLRRAATVLLHLAKVPENRKLFVYHQSRLLSLVMSQILDQTVASILSDVLFQCSQPT